MIIHFLVYILAPCPEVNVDYYSNDLRSVASISSWQECSRLCAAASDCFAWSWVTPAFGTANLRKLCLFKKNTWESGRKALTGVVSGPKTCVGTFLSP